MVANKGVLESRILAYVQAGGLLAESINGILPGKASTEELRAFEQSKAAVIAIIGEAETTVSEFKKKLGVS